MLIPSRLRVVLERFLRARGKHAFFASLPRGARVLDIGCGDDPAHFSAQRPGTATWALYGFESIVWATLGSGDD